MKENHSKTTQLVAVLVLTVFCISVLLVLLTCASVYRNLVDAGEDAYNCRTAFGYLTTRIRQAEAVRLEGNETLILIETLDGEQYETRVFCTDGYLRELYTISGALISEEAGEPILEVECISFFKKENLLVVMLGEKKLLLHLPCELEVVS